MGFRRGTGLVLVSWAFGFCAGVTTMVGIGVAIYVSAKKFINEDSDRSRRYNPRHGVRYPEDPRRSPWYPKQAEQTSKES